MQAGGQGARRGGGGGGGKGVVFRVCVEDHASTHKQHLARSHARASAGWRGERKIPGRKAGLARMGVCVHPA